MRSNLTIKCRAVPVDRHGPLIPRLAEGSSFLSLHVNNGAPCPRGLNIDSLLIFDMQADGGLDAIEIIVRMESVLRSGYVFPRGDEEEYWRLILEPSHDFVGEPDVVVSVEWTDNILTCRWNDQEADTHYLLGPGITALVGKNLLPGLQTDLTNLAIR